MISQQVTDEEITFYENLFCKSPWNIKSQWIQDSLASIKQKATIASRDDLTKHLYSLFQESDISVYGNGGFPQNCKDIERGVLQDPVFVQIESSRDMSLSLQEEANNKQKFLQNKIPYSSKRTLSIRVTDGVQMCTCMELETVPSLSLFPTPGSKLIILTASIRRGILLLNRESIVYLGGFCQRCKDEQSITDSLITSKLGLLLH